MAGDNDIFEWCAARPLWQQEAIRLLAGKPKLDEDELRQLEEAVRAEAGILSGKPPVWPALTKTHLKAGNKFAPVTVLGSIGPRNIDRLAADQPPLRFAINGVTLIYGQNGSGKSGYCRIAKKICHCLHDVTLRGNVFEPQSLVPREITLTFRVDGDKEKRTVVWNDKDSPPLELGRISVFDSDAAGLYVDAERNIEFLPFELALLTNPAEALRILDSRFKAEEARLRCLVTSSIVPHFALFLCSCLAVVPSSRPARAGAPRAKGRQGRPSCCPDVLLYAARPRLDDPEHGAKIKQVGTPSPPS
jgi:hypothetical protein